MLIGRIAVSLRISANSRPSFDFNNHAYVHFTFSRSPRHGRKTSGGIIAVPEEMFGVVIIA
jgi:hypothetical protein